MTELDTSAGLSALVRTTAELAEISLLSSTYIISFNIFYERKRKTVINDIIFTGYTKVSLKSTSIMKFK